jgi:hypothetical protein
MPTEKKRRAHNSVSYGRARSSHTRKRAIFSSATSGPLSLYSSLVTQSLAIQSSNVAARARH